MRKAVTPVVSIILLILITVTASAGAFFWISNVQGDIQEDVSGQTSFLPGSDCSQLQILNMRGNGVTVQNTGCDSVGNVTLLIDGVLTTFDLTEPVAPGESSFITFDSISADNEHCVTVVLNNGLESQECVTAVQASTDAGFAAACTVPGDCDDSNVCTIDDCVDEQCENTAVSDGQVSGCDSGTNACMSGVCTNTCGDATCQSWEDSASCVADCPLSFSANSASIVEFSDGLMGYCNASTDNSSLILTYQYKWIKDGATNISNTLVDVMNLGAYDGTNCGIRASDNRVMCWGYGTTGGVGNGTTYAAVMHATLTSDTSAYNSSRGGPHSCGVRASDGRVLCWGWNFNGDVGDGTTTQRNTPTLTSDTDVYTFVTGGYLHTCGVRASDGRVLCWGNNDNGRLGDGTTTQRNNPTLTSDTNAYLSVELGESHTCGIRASDNRVLCWGYNQYGRLGDGTTTQRTSPTLTSDTSAYLMVSASNFHTCGIRASDGRVLCWGNNGYGQLGDGTTTQRNDPTLINDTSAYSSIATGSDHTCGLRASDGRVLCWGRGDRIGDGTGVQKENPTLTSDTDVYSSISTGIGHTCGVRASDNRILCWGSNANGQLGDGTSDTRLVPTLITSTESFNNFKLFNNEYLHVNTLPINFTQSGQTWNFSCRVTDYSSYSDWVTSSIDIT